MKLKVFYATDGDCLMLTSSDGHHALIDGGRTTSFRDQTWAELQRLARRKQVLDLVVVSHIDADHISGILWLMKALADWTVFDFQVGEGGNPRFPKPKVPRPPTIKKVWHNSWQAQLKDLAGPIEALVAEVTEAADPTTVDESSLSKAAADMFDALRGLAQSIPDGIELRRLIDDATPVPRNKPFKDLVLLRTPPHVEKLGTVKLTVIGPGEKHLERLREDWRKWLAERLPPAPPAPDGPGAGVGSAAGVDELANAVAARRASGAHLVTSLAAAAKVIEQADAKKVTPPNRASITILAEEKRRTCLLTGDAAEEELLEGLEAGGRIKEGRFDCNVLKVQHHGSEYNLSRTFAETVLADHYVFCGDGAHHNPDPSVVRTIVDTRIATDPRPFTLWFNCSAERTPPGKRKAMAAALAEAREAEDAHANVSVRVLDDAKAFFEITV